MLFLAICFDEHMIYAETTAHRTLLAEVPLSYRFIGEPAMIEREQRQLRQAAHALTHLGERGELAFAVDVAFDRSEVVMTNQFAFVALQRVFERFEEGAEHHHLETGLRLDDADLIAPGVIGADGFLRRVSDEGVTLIYGSVEDVVGSGGLRVGVDAAATTVAYQYDVQVPRNGDPILHSDVEHLSFGHIENGLYVPIGRAELS